VSKEHSGSVSARLGREVAALRLQHDPVQQHAALRLDTLSEELRRHSPSAMRRFFTRFPWVGSESANSAPRGLYLWGGVGRGKTLLMDLFFASLHGSAAATGAQRVHFYQFMRAVHAQLGELRDREDPLQSVAEHIARHTRVICLDEFMVTDIADAMILAGLLAGLFSNGVTLVATSNLPPRDLYADGLQRQRFLPAIDLIQSNVDVLHVDGGSDYRLRQLERAPTYFDSGRPETAVTLRSCFESLAAGAANGSTRIAVEGRTLHAVAIRGDVAWFEFKELCEGARSQNDYLELARLYGTLIVSNIPVLTPQHEDAARRFIMLIDSIYDRGVKILVSAAAAPAALYRGERLQSEFRRAASRLAEMQTKGYLAGRHRA